MEIALDKKKVAKALAAAHREIEPSISRIIQVVADRDADSTEPVKLLEVNPETSESGILPVVFGADPPKVPFPSVVIEVTEGEYEAIRAGNLRLPDGWRLGDTLFPAAA
jgi:hypothetical protein